jgi:hypothetical protein
VSRVVFLLEERSMRILLEGLLPRLLPGLQFVCIPHEGKQDLEKSIPRKLRAWNEPGARFVVVRDNDIGDCRVLKKRLTTLCTLAGRWDTLVRIPCQELEAWYLGDPNALACAFDRPALAGLHRKARFKDPDAVQRPSAELAKLVPEFQKITGARLMAAVMTEEGSHSRSFKAFLSGLRKLGAGPGESQSPSP